MSKPTGVGHPIYSLMPTEVEGFDFTSMTRGNPYRKLRKCPIPLACTAR
jgi:hypothetical protein